MYCATTNMEAAARRAATAVRNVPELDGVDVAPQKLPSGRLTFGQAIEDDRNVGGPHS